MFRNLNPQAIGIRIGFSESLTLAAQTGWQGVDLPIAAAADLVAQTSLESLRALISQAGLRLGGWSLPETWRTGADRAALTALATHASLAQDLGCARCSTWLLPASDDLPFRENFDRHVDLLRPVAQTLADHGCRLGLEFIGPRHMRLEKRYGFIYSLDAMLCLAQAIGPNAGLLLDSYHWYTALGAPADIRALREADIVNVHINDAPSGVPVEAQQDQVRRLPGETGVIDLPGFLAVLAEIGYAGPVTPEPFDPSLASLSPEEASRHAHASLLRVWQS